MKNDKLVGFQRAITAEILRSGKIPREIRYDDALDYVKDACSYLFTIYKGGKLSFPSYCWRYARQIAVRNINADYNRLKFLIEIDDMTDGNGNIKRQYGKMEIEPRKNMIQLIQEKSDIEYLKEVVRDRERKLIDYMLADLRYEEIASILGISKGTVTKHLRKLSKYFKNKRKRKSYDKRNY